jgi:hypothetical protein
MGIIMAKRRRPRESAAHNAVAVSRRECRADRTSEQETDHGLNRFAARQARRACDDFTGTRSEPPEIDGRDRTALLEQCGDHVRAVHVGPPFIPPLLVFRPARHGNTKTFPHAYLYATDRDAGSSSNDPCVARFPPRSEHRPGTSYQEFVKLLRSGARKIWHHVPCEQSHRRFGFGAADHAEIDLQGCGFEAPDVAVIRVDRAANFLWRPDPR